jgi:hypothetical protein
MPKYVVTEIEGARLTRVVCTADTLAELSDITMDLAEAEVVALVKAKHAAAVAALPEHAWAEPYVLELKPNAVAKAAQERGAELHRSAMNSASMDRFRRGLRDALDAANG